MSIDYFKYDLYRKYQTSDGVTFTPLDEYQAVMTDYQMNDDCGFINYANLYYGGIKQTQYPGGTKFRQFKIINNRECMPQIVDNKNYNGEGGGTVIYGSDNVPYCRYDYYGGREYELLGIQNKDITDLSKAFYGCDNLYKADLNNWDTSNVTNMSEMFRASPLYNGLEIDSWDTSNVTNMSAMFRLCKTSKLDISKWNTSNVTDMSYMFKDCTNLTSLDLSSWDTSNVTTMYYMFNDCTNLTSLDLSSWDTSNVTDMSGMFHGCQLLTSLDLSNFNTSNVTSMSYMFYWCTNLTSLDLSNFNTSNVTSMREMFDGCDKLNHIKCKQAFQDWCITKQSTINLPAAMREGGSGTWEIVV